MHPGDGSLLAESQRRKNDFEEVAIVDPVPRQFFFRYPDGNRFLIVQPDRPSPSENSLEAKEPE